MQTTHNSMVRTHGEKTRKGKWKQPTTRGRSMKPTTTNYLLRAEAGTVRAPDFVLSFPYVVNMAAEREWAQQQEI